MYWVLTQQFFRLVYQIIQTARDLHSRDRGDNRHDDGNDIEWNCPWLHADGGKYQNTQPTCESNTDAPKSGAQKDCQQNNDKFDNYHISLPCCLTS